jgi:hypothetical protein
MPIAARTPRGDFRPLAAVNYGRKSPGVPVKGWSPCQLAGFPPGESCSPRKNLAKRGQSCPGASRSLSVLDSA